MRRFVAIMLMATLAAAVTETARAQQTLGNRAVEATRATPGRVPLPQAGMASRTDWTEGAGAPDFPDRDWPTRTTRERTKWSYNNSPFGAKPAEVYSRDNVGMQPNPYWPGGVRASGISSRENVGRQPNPYWPGAAR